MKKSSRPDEISSGLNGRRGRSISIAMVLILVVLLSAGSGVYAGASFFAQQAPGVTVTTTIYTTTTSWTTSTIWSTVTEVVQGILTTIEYTTSTSTVTVTGSTSTRAAKTITAYGNARISTAQSKFGGASGFFSGNGAYLSTPKSADWDFGTGDFTVDFWVYNTVWASASIGLVSSSVSGGSGWSIGLFYSAERVTGFGLTSNTNMPRNQWAHIAICRSGNSIYMFQNGVQVASSSGVSGTNYNSGGQGIVVGRWYTNYNSYFLSGWLDEVRISKGVARWTSNFTPPSAPYVGDSNSVLLLHMDGADGSTTFVDS